MTNNVMDQAVENAVKNAEVTQVATKQLSYKAGMRFNQFQQANGLIAEDTLDFAKQLFAQCQSNHARQVQSQLAVQGIQASNVKQSIVKKSGVFVRRSQLTFEDSADKTRDVELLNEYVKKAKDSWYARQQSVKAFLEAK